MPRFAGWAPTSVTVVQLASARFVSGLLCRALFKNVACGAGGGFSYLNCVDSGI